MPIHNSDVASIFRQVADLLEIEGANSFRVRAYRDGAATAAGLSRSLSDMVEGQEDLSELPDIGEDLAGKIEEIVKSGKLEQLEEIKQRVPPSLANMLNISGLGPKRVRRLYEEMGIETLDDLEKAARQEKLRQLEGFGPKIEHDILEDLERKGGQEKRTLLLEAEQIAKSLVEYMRKCDFIDKVVLAGSYRRHKQTVGDLDLVATSEKPEKVMQHFVEYEDVEEVESQGENRSTVNLRSGIQVDLRVVPAESFGATLFYFTGSRAHNLTLRNMALDRDLKINEYGVFQDEDRIAGKTEEELYAVFDLPYIEPELREDRGEIQAAKDDKLPELISLADIRGDMQIHTTQSDGSNSLEEMMQAGAERGYEYMAVTDHSKYIGITQGLTPGDISRQIDEIDRLNEGMDGFTLLKGIEIDIEEDGSLALSDDILDQLDFRICAVHSKFNLSREKQTERILRAMDSPYFNILAHPTGRRIGDRPPYEIDMGKIMRAALKRGCYLEVNASPDRLDLNDIYCKTAKEMGLKVVISTDAHRTGHLDYMRFGVWQARRGWLSAEDVLNTRSMSELKQMLERN